MERDFAASLSAIGTVLLCILTGCVFFDVFPDTHSRTVGIRRHHANGNIYFFNDEEVAAVASSTTNNTNSNTNISTSAANATTTGTTTTLYNNDILLVWSLNTVAFAVQSLTKLIAWFCVFIYRKYKFPDAFVQIVSRVERVETTTKKLKQDLQRKHGTGKILYLASSRNISVVVQKNDTNNGDDTKGSNTTIWYLDAEKEYAHPATINYNQHLGESFVPCWAAWDGFYRQKLRKLKFNAVLGVLWLISLVVVQLSFFGVLAPAACVPACVFGSVGVFHTVSRCQPALFKKVLSQFETLYLLGLNTVVAACLAVAFKGDARVAGVVLSWETAVIVVLADSANIRAVKNFKWAYAVNLVFQLVTMVALQVGLYPEVDAQTYPLPVGPATINLVLMINRQLLEVFIFTTKNLYAAIAHPNSFVIIKSKLELHESSVETAASTLNTRRRMSLALESFRVRSKKSSGSSGRNSSNSVVPVTEAEPDLRAALAVG